VNGKKSRRQRELEKKIEEAYRRLQAQQDADDAFVPLTEADRKAASKPAIVVQTEEDDARIRAS
jgi:hypothetical protein